MEEGKRRRRWRRGEERCSGVGGKGEKRTYKRGRGKREALVFGAE